MPSQECFLVTKIAALDMNPAPQSTFKAIKPIEVPLFVLVCLCLAENPRGRFRAANAHLCGNGSSFVKLSDPLSLAEGVVKTLPSGFHLSVEVSMMWETHVLWAHSGHDHCVCLREHLQGTE